VEEAVARAGLGGQAPVPFPQDAGPPRRVPVGEEVPEVA
jgi:hypothetical protein